MNKNYKLHSLGSPSFRDADGNSIHVKTRKALGILVYLFRRGGAPVSREELAEVFWSGAPREKASQSLRQALSQLRSLEQELGCSCLTATHAHMAAELGSVGWDLDEVSVLVEREDTQSLERASRLWAGSFMQGFDNLDPEFASWLLKEREALRTAFVTRLQPVLESADGAHDAERLEVVAKLILRIESANEAAHQALIGLYRETGRPELAEQQIELCERELRAYIEARPIIGKSAVFPGSHQARSAEVRDGQGPKSALPADFLQADADTIRLPKISIATLAARPRGVGKADALKDEIVNGLSSFQSFDLYQSEYEDQAAASVVTKFDDGELGSYLLRFRPEPELNKVYLQFEDRQTGKILFNEVVDLRQWSDAVEAQTVAFQTVSRVHAHVIGRLRNPRHEAPFAKWCQVEALLWEFSPDADSKALQILNDLERGNKNFSMTYAGKSSIQMKQMLYYPAKDYCGTPLLDEALMLAEKAVTLDPWQALNQRMFGWALILSGSIQDAGNAFTEAGRLNKMDPGNQMSVAEGLAAVGRIGEALQIAEKALTIFSSVPRMYYEYMANIYFAASEYDRAIEYVERAPLGSLMGLATRVSSLLCTGREIEARSILELYKDSYKKRLSASLFEQVSNKTWDQRINVFQDPKIRQNFMQGANMVRRSILGEF